MVRGLVRAAASLAWRRAGPGAGRHSRCGHTDAAAAVAGQAGQAAGAMGQAGQAAGVAGQAAGEVGQTGQTTGEAGQVGQAAGEAEPLRDLLGRRHNYLRISLTERCNLRCSYCMPAAGVPLSARGELLARGETLRLAGVLAALGVDKVRLTGGEPTLRADLPLVIEGLRGTAGVRSVSMTTNGLVLTRRLPALQRAGLDALNVSLDSLRADRYERMARRPGLSRVLAGIDLALQLGYRPVKVNTVLIKGFNDDEICDFAEFTRDRDVDVRFIEFMPFSGNEWAAGALLPYRAALRVLTARHPELRPLAPAPHHTARMWQVPGYAGRVGFIASMTQPFCSTCNRLRLTADGNLKVCLFGAAEVSLRDALRAGASDRQLQALVRAALRNKKPAHAGMENLARMKNRPMILIALKPRPLPGRGASLPGRAGPLPGRAAARAYSTAAGEFSHLDSRGEARMVDVGHKPVSAREAEAECSLQCGARLVRLLRDAALPKGDARCVARVAGVLAAKRAAGLLPLCHPLPLDCVRVQVLLPGPGAGDAAVVVRCSVRTSARTGAEMEALTGAAVAALALYDMCKSVDKAMRITDLRVLRKLGGKSDPRPPPAPAPAPPAPGRDAESYAPSNFVH